MKWLSIQLIRFYRKVLSPLKKQPTCRFTPTCSQYAIEALETRGFFAGTILWIGRVLRCNPFCRGGYDPVPEKGFKRQNDPKPITKYYYPEEYHLERDDNEKA